MLKELSQRGIAGVQVALADTPVRLTQKNPLLYFVWYGKYKDPVAEFSHEFGDWRLHYRSLFALMTDAEREDFRVATSGPLKDYIALWQITKRLMR